MSWIFFVLSNILALPKKCTCNVISLFYICLLFVSLVKNDCKTTFQIEIFIISERTLALLTEFYNLVPPSHLTGLELNSPRNWDASYYTHQIESTSQREKNRSMNFGFTERQLKNHQTKNDFSPKYFFSIILNFLDLFYLLPSCWI